MNSVPSHIRILHLEDSQVDADLIARKLRAGGLNCSTTIVNSREKFIAALDQPIWDIILCDYNLPDYDGISALQLARAKLPETPIIFISGSLGEDEAVKCLQHGATDYLLKERLERLVSAVERALKEAEQNRQRALAARQLRESEERFRQITETSYDLISLLDLSGTRIYQNPAYTALLMQSNLPLTESCFNHIHPEDRPRMQEVFETIIREDRSIRSEYRFVAGNGNIHHVESQGSVVHDASGKAVHVLLVSRDISDRRKAEEQIREQAALLDEAQDAIYVRNLDQQITYWNKAAERLYEWTQVEVLSKNQVELYLEGNSSQRAEARREVREKGVWMGELTQTSKSGREIIVESRRTLLRDEHGVPKSILIINTDITQRKRAAIQMLRAQRLESIGTLAGGVAHDLNNALAPIMMATDLLRMKYPGGSELVDTIEASAQRGADMVRQLLTFAKGVEGSRRVVQPEHLITEIERIIHATFPKDVSLKTKYAENLLPILGDSTQLHQVLLNLCVNARDAMPDGGTITLQSDNVVIKHPPPDSSPDVKPGNYILWRVSDTGAGIPPEILDRIFEPFFSTKSADKGTGLGLSTILGIVQSHYGFIQVRSSPGKGSVFSIYLPAHGVKQNITSNRNLNETPSFFGQGELILVVDDEPAVCEVAIDVLTSLNFHVITASDGNEALRKVTENKTLLRAIITDLHMPKMNGLTFARSLQRIAPDLPIIISSGFMDEAEAQAFEKMGITNTLDKPFNQVKLSEVLGKTLLKNGARQKIGAAH